jgi:hypothetical protein
VIPVMRYIVHFGSCLRSDESDASDLWYPPPIGESDVTQLFWRLPPIDDSDVIEIDT